ncbi:PaaI family thioesterase [Paracoccus liaowanqingii]|nr:PaaI family thioesterase [Paracoccus liaowanqingii]
MTASDAAIKNGNPDAIERSKMNGMEIVSAMAEGRLRRPPMADLLPFALLRPEEGFVTLVALPEIRFSNPMMTMHGGWIMTMLDTAMALAAQTLLEPGQSCPSHETSAKFVRPIRVETGEIRVTGKVVSRGRTVITLEGRVEDIQGRLYAHGTSTCLIMQTR